ncbi:MAG: hypothetical protein KDE51_18435 [Anaerolineales bacterium]|nr:hypothetical protein [Anaerolineales bacterium]
MNKHTIVTLLATSIVALFVSACTTAGGEEWTTHSSETLGISVDIPNEWVFKEENGELMIADSEANLDAQNISTGVGIVMQSESLETMGVETMQELLDFFMGFMTAEAPVEVVDEAQTVTINNLEAAQARVRGEIEGQNGTFTMAFIDKGDGEAILALFVDATVTGDSTATIDQILQSVKTN